MNYTRIMSTVCVALLGSSFSVFPRVAAPQEKTKTRDNHEHPYKIKVLRSKSAPQEQKYFLYLKGTLQHMTGELKEALGTFKTLHQSSSSRATYDGFIRFLFDAEQFATLAQLSDEIWDHFADDVDIQLIRAKTMLQANNNVKAEQLFEKLSQHHPDNEQVLYYTIVFRLKQQKFDAAFALVDKALANKRLRQKHFLFYFLKSKLFFAQGKHQQALALAHKSVKLFPRFAKGWLFHALLLEQMGKIDAAIAGYKRFLDIAGGDESVEKQLIHLLFSHGRFSQAASRLKKMKSTKPEYFFDMALLEWKAGKQKDALSSIDKALQVKWDFIKAKLLKIEILLAMKKTKKLLTFMTEWLGKSPEDKKGFQTLLLLARTGVSSQEIIKVLKRVVKKGEKQTLALLALSDLYMRADNFQQALNFYAKLVKHVKKPALKGKILYQIAYIHFTTGKHDQLENTLKQALQLTPVLPAVYNLFAYHLAHTGKSLDKAHEYVDKALESNQSPYFFDTKGYAYLKQGNFKQAQDFFHKALVLAPHDKTIREHYAQAVRQSVQLNE